jgi:sulfite reductase (NADPH) flavoprotein alpha-component
MTDQSDAIPPAKAAYSRQQPFMAHIIEHRRLSKAGSEKDTRHFGISIAGSGMTYEPGDSLGVFANNAPPLVDEVLRLLKLDPEATVTNPEGQAAPLRQALLHHYILNRANRKILSGLSTRIPTGAQHHRLMELLNNESLLGDYVFSRDYVNVLEEFDEARFESPQSFLAQLSPVTPRLYSIASAQSVHGDAVHLCIGVVRYETHGRQRAGFCSGFFADHSSIRQSNIPVYVQPSKTFHLPESPSTDILLCGNGTGIAPYRAFLQQRVHDGATGRHWLVFGDQRRDSDFLYGNEWLDYQKQGKLHRLDLAFSRDQAEKIYVQHRLQENAREVWDWLQNGAHFYLCGDARHMAKDVHQTVIEIARKQGGMSPDAAAEYVNQTLMKTEKRYRREVY